MFLSRIWIDSGGSITCDVVGLLCLSSITRLPCLTAQDINLNSPAFAHPLTSVRRNICHLGAFSPCLYRYIRANPALVRKKVPEIGGGLYVRS